MAVRGTFKNGSIFAEQLSLLKIGDSFIWYGKPYVVTEIGDCYVRCTHLTTGFSLKIKKSEIVTRTDFKVTVEAIPREIGEV